MSSIDNLEKLASIFQIIGNEKSQIIKIRSTGQYRTGLRNAPFWHWFRTQMLDPMFKKAKWIKRKSNAQDSIHSKCNWKHYNMAAACRII